MKVSEKKEHILWGFNRIPIKKDEIRKRFYIIFNRQNRFEFLKVTGGLNIHLELILTYLD